MSTIMGNCILFSGGTFMIDFSKLGKQSQSSSIEPRDIFMALPEKSEYYEYPRDVQSEVWKQWFESRDNKNTIIKIVRFC